MQCECRVLQREGARSICCHVEETYLVWPRLPVRESLRGTRVSLACLACNPVSRKRTSQIEKVRVLIELVEYCCRARSIFDVSCCKNRNGIFGQEFGKLLAALVVFYCGDAWCDFGNHQCVVLERHSVKEGYTHFHQP